MLKTQNNNFNGFPKNGLITAEERAWPKIRQIKGADLLPVPEWTEDLIPESLRTWWCDVNERGQYAPEFTAVAIITILGSIIGTSCRIRPKQNDDWSVVPNLWSLVVAPPGARKSGALGETKAFLDDLSTPSNEKQNQRDFYICDSTVERLGELLAKDKQGILLFRDEIAGFLNTLGKKGREGDTAFFLEGWNGGGSYRVERIARGRTQIENMCISILGGIQPEPIAKYARSLLRNGDNGMMQRFQLLVCPDIGEWQYIDREPNQKAKDSVIKVFKTLEGFDYIAAGAQREKKGYAYFHFNEGAQNKYKEWMENLHKNIISVEKNSLIHEHLNKYDSLVPRLALIFYLIQRADGKLGETKAVDEESLDMAIKWVKVLEAHMRRFYKMCLGHKIKTEVGFLSEKIGESALEQGFTVRDISRKHWSILSDEKKIEIALDNLEENGWVRKLHNGCEKGRPTTRYEINPVLLREGNLQ